MKLKSSFFHPGQHIILREVWCSRILRALPLIVISDSPEMIALYAPPNTLVKYPRTSNGDRVRACHRLAGEWVITDLPSSQYDSLRLAIPGEYYSVILFRNPDLTVHHWYINLEDPLSRTNYGFEVRDHFLDILVAPDLSSWQWKDEDEFAEALELGIISREKAASLRAEGERVAGWICSGSSQFTCWEDWQPDPDWTVPALPPGWDDVV